MTKHMRLEFPDETYDYLGALAKVNHRDKKSQVLAVIDKAIAEEFPQYASHKKVEAMEE